MKKIFLLFTIAFCVLFFEFPANASVTNITPTIPHPRVNEYYSARIKFFYSGGTTGPNVTVSYLPPGISLVNATSTYTNSIYALNQRDSDGYYYIDLTGTPSGVAGSTYNIEVHFYDTLHTFDLIQTYPVTVQTSKAPTYAKFITAVLPNGTQGQYYSARIQVSSDGTFSPNFIVNYLPDGISVANASAGWKNSIYGDGAKDSSGFYYVELSGDPTVAGNFAVEVRTFNTFHTFDTTKNFSLTINATAAPPPPPPSGPGMIPVYAGNAHTDYTNILGPDGTVYRIADGQRYAYTSAGAFSSYGFNSWSSIASATTGDMNLPVSTYWPSGSTMERTYFIPPRNGSLINDNGTIYLITNGLRAGFTSAKNFLDLGYSFVNAQRGDTSFMVSASLIDSTSRGHADGTLVNDRGTIYPMRSNGRLGFPSMSVFNSWGLKLSEVVPANSYDRELPLIGTMSVRLPNQLSI